MRTRVIGIFAGAGVRRFAVFAAAIMMGVTTMAQGQANSPDAAPVAQTEKGKVRGAVEPNGVLVFRGIPYAEDTGGANRFLPPKPRKPWSGELDGSVPGPACPQEPMLVQGRPLSEDCLRVNVWTRSLAGKRPVVVWFHGGAYKIGSNDYLAEGANGAFAAGSGDIVFVSLNHRLNVLGYLQLGPEFGKEYARSGNVGLLDLVAALTWVKHNIAKFGGDPNNVTIAGPSGGGSKTMHSLAMPAMKGLFEHAIVFSGHDLWKRNSAEAARKSSDAVLKQLGVEPGDIAKLRALPYAAIQQAYADVSSTYGSDPSWGAEGWVNYDILSPNIDGVVVPEYPMDAIAKGAGKDVDLIVAVDQWTHWMTRRTPPASFDKDLFGSLSLPQLADTLRPMLRDRTDDIVASYRKALPGASPSSLLALIVTDRDWWIPGVRLAEAKAKGGNPGRMLFSRSGGNAHSYMFGTNMQTAFAPALIGQVKGAYNAFALTGDPNHPGIPAWPVYTPQSRKVLMLEHDVNVADDPFQAQRMIWDGIR